MPLPDHIDQDVVLAEISAGKDVDGLTPVNAGLLAQGRIGVREALDVDSGEPVVGLIPCTPAGVIEILDRSGVELSGAEAVVIGRSILVGRPMASLLVNGDATVTVCHSRTRDLAAVCRRADILIAAVGRPEMVKGDWIKPGATVIDVGMNRTDDGLVGDVEFDSASAVAGRITPVPGRRRADDDRDAARQHGSSLARAALPPDAGYRPDADRDNPRTDREISMDHNRSARGRRSPQSPRSPYSSS